MTSKPFASTATHHQLTFQSQISGTLNLSTLFQVDLQRANSLKLPTAQRSEKLWKNDTNHASTPRNESVVPAVAEIWQNWQAGRLWAAGLPESCPARGAGPAQRPQGTWQQNRQSRRAQGQQLPARSHNKAPWKQVCEQEKQTLCRSPAKGPGQQPKQNSVTV